MPLIESSSYRAPRFAKNTHLQTIYRALFRKLPPLHYQRERLETPDGDFLDLDWLSIGSSKLVVGLHGLEGHSQSTYITGLIHYFNQQGWDGLALNFRGCGGEPNRLLRTYHSGETTDLAFVLSYIAQQKQYTDVVLVGFSLGGNVALKYVGELGEEVPQIVQKVAAVSVPCDLASSSIRLAGWENRMYMIRFLLSLKKKMKKKYQSFPGNFDLQALLKARNFKDFDDAYTAPVHGFKDAADYWERASSAPFLQNIRIPALLINAADDSFLGAACYPRQQARNSSYFYLEIPEHGGHVGFLGADSQGFYWIERRIWQFVVNGR